jgi:ribose-phosphate pyrophosphokinase
VLSIDLHTGQTKGFFDVPFDALTATPMLADHLAPLLPKDFVVVSPDPGGVRLADKWIRHLGEFHDMHGDVAFLHKRRSYDARNESRTLAVVGEVKDRVCVIVDDLIDTAGTLTDGALALERAGAGDVFAAATHPVLSGPAIDRIKNAPIKQLAVTNTLPIPSEKKLDNMIVLSVAPTIAQAIKAVFEEESVSELFHGENQP